LNLIKLYHLIEKVLWFRVKKNKSVPHCNTGAYYFGTCKMFTINTTQFYML